MLWRFFMLAIIDTVPSGENINPVNRLYPVLKILKPSGQTRYRLN